MPLHSKQQRLVTRPDEGLDFFVTWYKTIALPRALHRGRRDIEYTGKPAVRFNPGNRRPTQLAAGGASQFLLEDQRLTILPLK
jgi:hypothetical protein